jgi:hypothetical protein
MLNLAVSVTPPKADSATARMSPLLFTISSPTRASIKRKASLPEITERSAKHFRLEPPADSTDTTIAEYQQRVNRDDGILVMIPFEGTWTTILKKVARLEQETAMLRLENAALRQENAALQQKYDVLQQKFDVLQQRVCKPQSSK